MPPRATLLACVLIAFSAVAAPSLRAAEAPLRLSQMLSTEERTATGIARLTSDQVAVLDALYRRDLVAQSAPRRADAPAPAAGFSQRLSADERRNAGLATLTDAEVAQLDALAERSAGASLARTLLAPPTFIPLSVRARIAEAQAKKSTPEIHGSFTLGFGMGSGGYSEKFGGIALTYEDPARGLAIGFSYSESHVKGGPGPYYPGYSPIGLNPLDRLDGPPRYSPEW